MNPYCLQEGRIRDSLQANILLEYCPGGNLLEKLQSMAARRLCFSTRDTMMIFLDIVRCENMPEMISSSATLTGVVSAINYITCLHDG